jgi:hypothetical protein
MGPLCLYINYLHFSTVKLGTRLAEWETGLMPPLWPAVMEYEEEIDGVKMRWAF